MREVVEAQRLMVTRARAIGLLLSLLLLAGATASRAAQLTSSLERNPIHAGESVRLVLELTRAPGGLNPDLSPLEADFQILHTSVNTQVEFVQGRQSAVTLWHIELTPKREGLLEVPSIPVGRFRSEPLTLKVLPPRPDAAGSADIFLEAEIAPDPAYVQAQMRYVLRLLRAVDVVDGTLTEPGANNAVLRRLGHDISYTTTRNGQSYRVLERRYAVFPQASGALTIAPVEFQGEVVDAAQAGSGLSRLFARGRRVRLRTAEVRATALPPPAEFTGPAWLPAKSLQLIEEWSSDPRTLRAGEPVTRTLRLEALGLSAEQLPEIPATVDDDVKEYRDQPITRTTADVDWVQGVREQRIALVPTGPGTYTLPEIRIDWWDTERNVRRQATLPARVLEVAAGVRATPGAPPSAAPGDTPAPSPLALPLWQRPALWQAACAVLLALWLVTLAAWRRARRTPRATRKPPRAPGPAKPRPAASLRRACLADDPRAARAALLAWAAHTWPENPPRSLMGLAERLPDTRLRAELVVLDRTLYAAEPTPWRGEPLWQEARRDLVRPATEAVQARDDLPALYPR
ncbi:MAG: hypothetical protein GTO67_12305 [Gammaproteobacteria bacterium]|nr:hypothetical protein [Gammaproteobacteria bacterium]NIO25033.1 hypothetical protein [Gammaproteobacteria bacterium]NIO65665.1 hypothetical protein [Gammaproteobacteria bacterium]NIP64554.1 hypothetical protein [Gammaproteobacteria bacterium]NIR19933.1 hypothetical protein [Gammaproteobacteria bacterium]